MSTAQKVHRDLVQNKDKTKMNNTQEDQQGVEESLRNDTINATPDAADNSTEVAINDAPWYFSPDPKLRFHYQITTPHEPNCGVINVGTFPNSLFARHVCKLHNDWLQFKQNKKAKKQDKLLENLKSDFALFKKGFEVLQDGWFDLNYLGVKTFWKTNEDSKNAILAYIRGNKERVEHYLFLLWFKKHVDEFDRMLSKVSDGAKAVDILNHFSDVTLFDTKIGPRPRDRNIWDARAWYMTKKEIKDTLEDWFDCDGESVLLPEFDGDGKCEVLGLALMDTLYSAVDDWVERVKKMSIAEHIAACNPQKVARVFNAAAERYNEGVNGYVTEKNKVDGGAWEGLMEGNKPLDLTQDVDSITIPLNKKPESKPTCMRCKSCKDGCEFYDRGFCRGVCYPTYPPKWGKCVFDRKDGEGMDYFTDAEIEAIAKGEVAPEPVPAANRPGTNWKVGEPMPTPVLDDFQICEMVRKFGATVEGSEGPDKRLVFDHPVKNIKMLGMNPVYDAVSIRCPKEDDGTCFMTVECDVVVPVDLKTGTLHPKDYDDLMIESKIDIAAEVKSTAENLVKLSGRQVGKSSVNADASRELAKTLLGEGVVKEADEKVKAFINDEQPVEEDKVEQYEAKDEQQYDRSGAHKPLTGTLVRFGGPEEDAVKPTIKDLDVPQTYYVEIAIKDLVDHLHPGEKIRAVVCFNSRLMAYMPPTDNKTITIANFLGHTKSMANLYQQWRIPIGKQVEEYLSHDWWYDKKTKCWTYVCNIGCEKDPFEFMALTPVLWDNHTYLGKDKDYKEAPFKYT